MTSSAQAHAYLSQIENLVDRFAVIFPRWPSLTEARQAITRAARQLDQLDSGRNPFSPDNPDPAGTAINRPYSFLHFMATTAGATFAEQLIDPMTGMSLKISAPTRPDGSAAGIQETIDGYRAQLERAERIRAGGAVAPAPVYTQPAAVPSSSTPAVVTETAAAPAYAAASYAATSYAPSSSSGAVTSFQAVPSYASTSLNMARPAAAANSLAPRSAGDQVVSSARATGGNWLPILAVGLVGFLAFAGGKKKGGRR